MTDPGSAFHAQPPLDVEAVYSYVCAWALYHGASYSEIERLVREARADGAPQDAYTYCDDRRRWLTLRELQTQARTNVVASDQLAKIYEYLDAERRRPI